MSSQVIEAHQRLNHIFIGYFITFSYRVSGRFYVSSLPIQKVNQIVKPATVRDCPLLNKIVPLISSKYSEEEN